MRVRSASSVDAPAITAVRAASWRAGYAGVVPDEVLATIRKTPRPEMFDYLAELPPRHMFVVAEATDGTINGYCHGGPYRTDRDDDALPDADVCGEIFAIYVSPTSWGRGVGQALMNRSLRQLFDDGFQQVRLWVLADNPRAHRFYEAAGFRTDGAIGIYDAKSTALPLVRYRYQADSA